MWGGIPGEPARIRIDHVGRNQVRGDFRDSPKPDPHRVEPPCDRYKPCGGCPWMHLDAEGQLAHRRAHVAELMRHEGLDVEVDPVHPCPDGLSGYRHVVKVGFGRSDHGRVRVGAWGRGNRDIVPIPGCLATTETLRKVMVSLAHHTIQLKLEPFDGSDRGSLRAAVLRQSRATGEVMVTLVAARRDRRINELAEELARGNSEVVGVWLHLNDGPGNAIFQRDGEGVVGTTPLGGKDWIEEKLGEIAYRIGPGDFFQTNPSVAAVLYERTLARLELQQGDAVLDLYSGVGGMALPAAARTGFALGVEEIDGAVQRAKETARINRVPAEFVCGQVLEVLPEVRGRLGSVGAKVIVDPARRGLEDGVLDGILALEPARVAYVSCSPRALAKDLVAFRDRGWRVDGAIELFDMFPNTAHVEALAVLAPPTAQRAPERRPPQRKLVR